MNQDHEGVELQVRQTAVLRDADGKASTPTRRGIGTCRARGKPLLYCVPCARFLTCARRWRRVRRAQSRSVRCGATRSIGRSQSRAMAVFRYVLHRDVAERLLRLALVPLDRRLVRPLMRWCNGSCIDGEVP